MLRSSLAIEATFGGSKKEKNSNESVMGHHEHDTDTNTNTNTNVFFSINNGVRKDICWDGGSTTPSNFPRCM